MQKTREVYIILPDIRSAHNVGSVFRTADATGVSKIFLCGCTPTPLDHFGRPRKDIAKVALGAEKTIEWEYVKSTAIVLRKLKKEGVQIVAIEQADNSVDYKKVKPQFPVAIMFGNEVEGVSKKLLKQADVIAEIPMKGEKESLNISVSAGIALFRILGI
ncbi:MAG: TrmH family RNA methyltransferase [Candidatus Paceibacterota bacterium]|jgi:tRNA G18 (ribose-2'-O)-methylase SpoU